MLRPARQLALATVLLAVGVASPGSATEATTSSPAVLGAVTGHTVRTVEVVVLDQEGHAVPGLEAADFRLSIDGQPVPITSFAGPQASAARTAAAAVAALVPYTLAIFFDEASLSAAARDRALTELGAEAQRSLAPGDTLMIVASHATDFDLLLPPSGDPAAIAAGFAAARVRPALGTRGSELRQLLSAIANAANPNGESAVESRLGTAERAATLAEIRQYMGRRQREALDTVAALGKLVDALGGVPGRRAVIVVSGGLSSRPGQGPLGAWANRFQSFFGTSSDQLPQLDTFDRGTDAALGALAERANRSGVTLYGLGLADLAGGSELAGERVWTRNQQDTERSNVGQSLSRLAAATGGAAFENPGELGRVLRWAQADSLATYTLGWTSGPDDSTARQKLEIATRDPALVVRHRSSVPASEPGSGLRDRTLAALLLGSGDNPLDLKLQVESTELLSAAKEAATVLQLVVTLPLAKLSLLPHGGVHEGGLHLLFGSLDEGGRLSDLQAVEAPIRIANDQLLDAMGKLASYRVRLTLRPVAQRLAVGVQDDVGRTDATTTLEWSPSGSAPSVLQ